MRSCAWVAAGGLGLGSTGRGAGGGASLAAGGGGGEAGASFEALVPTGDEGCAVAATFSRAAGDAAASPVPAGGFPDELLRLELELGSIVEVGVGLGIAIEAGFVVEPEVEAVVEVGLAYVVEDGLEVWLAFVVEDGLELVRAGLVVGLGAFGAIGLGLDFRAAPPSPAGAAGRALLGAAARAFEGREPRPLLRSLLTGQPYPRPGPRSERRAGAGVICLSMGRRC